MHYDFIVVGSGFAGSFFTHRVLNNIPNARILVLERGKHYPLDWQIKNRRNTLVNYENEIEQVGPSIKSWPFSVGLGGSSNCWWANAMRLSPDEFSLSSKYSVGVDWPISYNELEEYYCDAEDIMNISGDNDNSLLFPRSRPFPQVPHKFSSAAKSFKNTFPDLFFAMPQARARVPTNSRNPCCSNSMCGQCPMNAKFTVINDLGDVFKRIELKTSARVTGLILQNNQCRGVEYEESGTLKRASSDVVVVAANGIFNPHLLLLSGDDSKLCGVGLGEQISMTAIVDLDGLDDGDGSAHITGVGYNFLHGDFRKKCGGGFYELTNLQYARPHAEKWRKRVQINFLLEDLINRKNLVTTTSNRLKPSIAFDGYTPYGIRAQEYVEAKLPALLAHLPVEKFDVFRTTNSEHAHLQCTTIMGNNEDESVVDKNLLHHKYRNLYVLGSSVFPTIGGANPTLTICALALRAADHATIK